MILNVSVEEPQVGDGVLAFRISGRQCKVTYNIEFGSPASGASARRVQQVFSIRAMDGRPIPRDYYQLELIDGNVLLVNNMMGSWEVDNI